MNVNAQSLRYISNTLDERTSEREREKERANNEIAVETKENSSVKNERKKEENRVASAL